MRKLFLIPLMSLLTCVMAFAGNVGTLQELKDALAAGGEITLTADIETTEALNVTQNTVIDGDNHTIKGSGARTNLEGENCWSSYNYQTDYHKVVFAVTAPEVTFKNLTIDNNVNEAKLVGIMTFDGVNSLTLDACSIKFSKTTSNHIGVAVYGTTADAMTLNIKNNSTIDGTISGYAIVPLKKINATITGSTLKGFSAMTFKYPLGLVIANRWADAFGTKNIGARGSVINATNSNFQNENIHSGESNGYGVFVCEEDGITVNLNACTVNAQATGNSAQRVLYMSDYTPTSRRSEPSALNITGASTVYGCIAESRYWVPTDQADNLSAVNNSNVVTNSTKISVNISGGTFSTDPNSIKIYYNVTEVENKTPAETSPAYTVDIINGGVVKDENNTNTYVFSPYDYDRTITNSYGTICVDKDGKFYGGTLYTIDQIANSTITLVETGNNDLVGGKAYVFIANGSTIHAVYNENASAKALVTNEALVGAYDQTEIDQNSDFCILKDNKYYHVDRTGVYVGEHRAYINLAANVVPSKASASRRRIVLHEAVENTATALDNVEAGAEAQKVVIDGQVFIFRGEHMYNAAGQVVK